MATDQTQHRAMIDHLLRARTAARRAGDVETLAAIRAAITTAAASVPRAL